LNRITIVGMGLIGTSLGLAIKRAELADIELIGTDMNLNASGRAKKMGAVDKTSNSLVASVQGSHMVIIATPVMAIKEVMSIIGPHLEENCVVTDTGSTKGVVLKWAKEYLPKTVSFVGGHPMAGKEQSGPEAAEATLFDGASYCVIPGEGARPEAVKSVVTLVEAVRARPLFLSAEEHDSYTAAVSHLPLILSTMLVTSTTASPAWDEMSKLAASGYKDLSRLASGDPEMSRDICLTNQDQIVHWINEYIRNLYDLRDKVKEGNGDPIIEVFIKGWEARKKWLAGVPLKKPEVNTYAPTIGDTAASMFLSDRLAMKKREFMEKTKRDPLKYFRKRQKDQ